MTDFYDVENLWNFRRFLNGVKLNEVFSPHKDRGANSFNFYRRCGTTFFDFGTFVLIVKYIAIFNFLIFEYQIRIPNTGGP